MTAAPQLDVAVRELAPRVLGALLRRHGGLDVCEDAVQEALIAAAEQWPRDGAPDNPFGWLYAVASRRLIDAVRADAARRAREERDAIVDPARRGGGPGAASGGAAELDGRPTGLAEAPEHDDSLDLLLLCCHPALASAAQIALSLRAVAGLTTAQIAAAFFTTETTMAQRITRAKVAIREAGASFPEPADDRPARLAAAGHAIYLLFNEGYVATAGDEVADPLLAEEAIRLARMAHRLEPSDGELTGLLALLLLTHARLPERADAATGQLVPLADQDRTGWDAEMLAEGQRLTELALAQGPPGAYALQAAIAAVHADAPSTAETDWSQIAELYALLERVAPGPQVTTGRAIATAEVAGPLAGLRRLDDAIAADPKLAHHHHLLATRAHLHEQLGNLAAAREGWAEAAELTGNAREREYLRRRARGASVDR